MGEMRTSFDEDLEPFLFCGRKIGALSSFVTSGLMETFLDADRGGLSYGVGFLFLEPGGRPRRRPTFSRIVERGALSSFAPMLATS